MQQFSFGELLRIFRKRLALSQNQLADAIQMSTRIISEWERGNYVPNRDTTLRLAKALLLIEEETDQLLLAARHLPHYHQSGPQLTPPLPHTASASTNLPHFPKRRVDCYHHISPPIYYIERREFLSTVRTQVLANAAPVDITSTTTMKPVALHSMGGIGKIPLAKSGMR